MEILKPHTHNMIRNVVEIEGKVYEILHCIDCKEDIVRLAADYSRKLISPKDSGII